jgi:predicted phage replisome organizer
MSEKKYYWLKLKRDFFKRHDIRIIEEMPNGKEYILFYLKLLLESIDHEGNLRFSDTVPYNEQMLSVITNTNIDVVRSAMKMFASLNMIEIFDDETIYMAEVKKLTGCETSVAERVRKHRETQKLLQCNTDVTKCNTEIEKDKEIDIDKEKECNKPQKRFTKPTLEEVQAYCQERNNGVDAQKWYNHYEAVGWKVGKNPMKDWKASVRTWERSNTNGNNKPNNKPAFDYDQFTE